jgi:hypothetical protein
VTAAGLTAAALPGEPARNGHGFVHALPVSRRPLCRQRFVEAFAGTCGMARAMASLGVPSESYEIERSSREDLLSASVTRVLRRDIELGRVGCLWFGITCASWSLARRGKPDYSGYPPPLRDSEVYLMGLPGLSPKDRHRVALGNRQARWLVEIIRVCRRFSVPVVVENPASSRLWLYLSRRLGTPSSDTVFNHCRYGASFSKPTRLWGWNVDLSTLGLRCSGKVCVASGEPHVTLSGSDGRAFRTSYGAEYPPAFCAAAARLLASACQTCPSCRP